MEITNTRVSSTPRPKADTAKPYLMVIAGGRVGELHTLTRERTIVGRSPEAHLRLDDEGISREHVELSVEPAAQGGRVTFRDLGSTNGTYLNGVRAEAREVRDGDKLPVGAATLLLFTHSDGLEVQATSAAGSSAPCAIRRRRPSSARSSSSGCAKRSRSRVGTPRRSPSWRGSSTTSPRSTSAWARARCNMASRPSRARRGRRPARRGRPRRAGPGAVRRRVPRGGPARGQ